MLNHLAWMHRYNEEFAEKNGGKENLPPESAKRYNAALARIVSITQFSDNAATYIAELEGWVDELIQENRRLAESAREQERGWKKLFPRLLKPETESQREHTRRLNQLELQMSMPNLF